MNTIAYDSTENQFTTDNIKFDPIFEIGEDKFVCSAVYETSIEDGWKHFILVNCTDEEVLTYLKDKIEHTHRFRELSGLMTTRELIQHGVNHGSYQFNF